MIPNYEPPEMEKTAYNCPHCSAYSTQIWHKIWVNNPLNDNPHKRSDIVCSVCFCNRCEKIQIWINKKMYYPISSIAPLPSDDMPNNVKDDFMEARNIVDASPRAAAALLRLALQNLMIHLGEKGKDLNTDIGNLVKNKGLSIKIQQALDTIRVIGNQSVHPGQIDLRDEPDTAISLFKILNIIVDAMITQPKLIDETYQKLPQSKIDQINSRDSTK